jgi:hypothetical protein
VHAIHHLGLQHMVALVGFDDVVLANVVEPGLTVIAQLGPPARPGVVSGPILDNAHNDARATAGGHGMSNGAKNSTASRFT